MATKLSSSNIAINHYVPCLRWKQGEYQALMRLSNNAKRYITPLIEIPNIGWDFQLKKEAKNIDEHLVNFGKRLNEKWGNRVSFVDLKLINPNERMESGDHPVEYIFQDLRNYNIKAIPVTGLERDLAFQKEVYNVAVQDDLGVCLRILIEQAAKPNFTQKINDFLDAYNQSPTEIDFILDLGAPNFVPIEGFTKMVSAIYTSIPYISKWRTITVCGTSFPQSMAQLNRGAQFIKRYEWQFYKKLVQSLDSKTKLPRFGDYAIAHPIVFNVDMRKVKPSASIRYTVDDHWLIIKGSNIRDNGNGQFVDLSKSLLSTKYYKGKSFSKGDEHIYDCARACVNPGNLTTWRWIGTNHHMEKLVQDIANFHAS